MRKLILAGALLALIPNGGPAVAREAPPTPTPAQVRAIVGCWSGEGTVMEKPVTIALSVKPAALGALVLVEADSRAKADPKDVYAAHLLLAGRDGGNGAPATITGFWADSFGGDGAALGAGVVRSDGFDVSYAYPDATFVNRWTLKGDRLAWAIAVRDKAGAEHAFADYAMVRTVCSGG